MSALPSETKIPRALSHRGWDITGPRENRCSRDNWPTPTSETEMRQFPWFVGYYRRFVPRYANIAAPLHYLLGGPKKHKLRNAKTSPFSEQWDYYCNKTFCELKRRLVSTDTHPGLSRISETIRPGNRCEYKRFRSSVVTTTGEWHGCPQLCQSWSAWTRTKHPELLQHDAWTLSLVMGSGYKV